jgi:lantibiotic leader peptide-processing serine protease
VRVHELHGTSTLAIDATPDAAAALRTSVPTATVVPDHVVALIDPESRRRGPSDRSHTPGPGRGARWQAPQDLAAALPGLLWNQDRVGAPRAHAVTYGDPTVTVGVADTGLDFTHPELADRVSGVVDFTTMENPPLCATYSGGFGDADLAVEYGGPAVADWNGHGTWIGGNIAAALDELGVNGIAPKVQLVGLKISQWCGAAYDSEILAALEYAAQSHLDVVSISFGGFLDRADPGQDAIYRAYVKTVAAAARAGTLVVAAAGNDHVRIGEGGRVLSHGSLTIPGDDVVDLYGLYESPGGIPGVVNVSSTGNVVAAPSRRCVPGDPKDTNAVCKPASDRHQATGIGKKDQLAYYSNYGPRIDIAAPGGARKFNLPGADRGGTPGFPVTSGDEFIAYEDFSITSNWATQIPCYVFAGAANPFHPDSCYATIQGTSMATPHVSAVAGLIVSAHPDLRHRPGAVLRVLRSTARTGPDNQTRGLSPHDLSPGDLTGTPCPTGYCHLGGPRIGDGEAYGSGIVDAAAAVR